MEAPTDISRETGFSLMSSVKKKNINLTGATAIPEESEPTPAE